MPLTYGSLFSGIDAFGLAAHELGFEHIFGCDNSPFIQAIWPKLYPGVQIHPDITALQEVPHVDFLMFGFPCQDASLANSNRPKNPLQDGNRTVLFWEAIRLVSESKPKIVIVENVPNLLQHGWEHVARAFTELGYSFGWSIISASQFGAEFQGKRLFGVATSDCFGWDSPLRILSRVADEGTRRQKTRLVKGSEKFCYPVCTEIPPQTDKGGFCADNGLPFWVYEACWAKAFGNSIFYPLAEVCTREVKIELNQMYTSQKIAI